MSTLVIKSHGDWSNTVKFLNTAHIRTYDDILNEYGKRGVEALSDATPVDTGKTASSWFFEIKYDNNSATIEWHNSNVVKDYANIAILLQYGHGTRNGGYVVGRDYINPAIRPIFDEMADKVWKEVMDK